MTGRLAKRYARALLELARPAGASEALGEELARVVATMDEPRLRPLLLSPAIDSSARLATTRKVVAALGLSPAVQNLVGLLAERGRLAILSDVARWYDELLDDDLGRARVSIRSAAPLAHPQRNALVELARQLTGRRDILSTTDVDPDLLGGVTLDIRGTVYDGSVRAALNRLSKAMAAGGA